MVEDIKQFKATTQLRVVAIFYDEIIVLFYGIYYESCVKCVYAIFLRNYAISYADAYGSTQNS